jgi:hypothetical protein
MQFCTRSGQVLPVEKIQQQHITLLGEVVTPLVGAVDETLDPGKIAIAGSGSTSLVLCMPQLEIGQVLLCQGAFEICQRSRYGGYLVMPGDGAPVVQRSDLQRIEGQGVRRAGGHAMADVVSSVGIEPTTHALKVRCSTD